MSVKAEVRALDTRSYAQISTRFDRDCGVFWAYMEPRPRACFTEELLADLKRYLQAITESHTQPVRDQQVRYGVLASKARGVFNLGGDLELFKRSIERGDREALVRYGSACVDNLYPWHRNCELPMTSIALVQGDALGGGFEAALSSSVLIAEETARLGFPEILFNLFPGMGAYSFLSRKVGRRVADELITSGNIYSARQLYDMGVVDVITAEGTGESAVYAYINQHKKGGVGRRGYERARIEVEAVSREELMRVVDVWATTALQLSSRDIKMMDRLVRAQYRTTEPVVFEAMGKVVRIH